MKEAHQGISLTSMMHPAKYAHSAHMVSFLSGEPDYFYRNKISSGGDLSHYSSASLY